MMTLPEWKRVCCAVDFSEPSRTAMRVASDVARRFGAELTLFHADQVPGYTLPEGTILPSPKMLQEVEGHTDRLLAEWKRDAEQWSGVRVDTAKAIGEPAVEIVEFAREGGFDLLVVGTHGRTGLRHAIVGSIAEKVVRRAPCPVLTVPPSGKGASPEAPPQRPRSVP